MKILKAFNKGLGGILYGFFVIFLVCAYLGGLALSVYIMLMPWVTMPFGTPVLDLPIETKVFVTSLAVIMLLTLLSAIYFSIDTWIDPTPLSFRPQPPKNEAKAKKPIIENRLTLQIGENEIKKVTDIQEDLRRESRMG